MGVRTQRKQKRRITDTRRAQFERAFFILSNNILLFDSIPLTIPVLYPLPITAQGYCNLPFFTNWIVGFTIAEGSFMVKGTGEFFFTLTQRTHHTLFEAFKLVFNTTTVIGGKGTPYMKFAVSSVRDLEKVVNFFSYSNLHPLVGYKGLQYNKWIDAMRTISRFSFCVYVRSHRQKDILFFDLTGQKRISD